MRTMMKKCGVFAACTAVLVAVATVVLSCPTPESSGGKEEKGYKPKPGMGAVRLNLASTTRSARSIIPGTQLTDFAKFDIDFQAKGGGGVSNSSNTNISIGSESGPYDLTPGKYDIVVVGYTASGDAAIGTTHDVVVNANDVTNTATITLESYDPTTGAALGTDTGTFNYTILNNINVLTLTTATMTFTKIAGAGAGPTSPVNLLSPSWSGNIVLTSGYYYVDFVLVTSTAGTRTFRHILHIYKNQISSFQYTFTDDYFTYAKIELTITFDKPTDPKPKLAKSTAPAVILTDGETITLSIDGLGGNPKTINITVNNQGDYSASSIKWYLSSNSTTALTAGVGGTNDSVLTINVATAPFNVQGLYQLTVEGTIPAAITPPLTPAVPTSSFILISIVP